MIQYNDISIDCAATKIHIDLTGGWKSALLFYLCADDIHKNQSSKTAIVPAVVRRINRYNVEGMHRPDAVPVVEQQIQWINDTFPDVVIDPLLQIDADFWWLCAKKTDPRLSIDISEKVLLRHTYEMCTYDRLFQVPEVIPDVPLILNYNAYCCDSDIVSLNQKNPYRRDKIFYYGKQLGQNTVSLCEGSVLSIRPFADTTKANLVEIAQQLNILEQLNKVSYTCEQSTTQPADPCGSCFNCLQMKKALPNNE